jgi:hypothetical protein
MNFQLTSLDILKAHQLRSKHIFIENSKKVKFQPKTGLKNHVFEV